METSPLKKHREKNIQTDKEILVFTLKTLKVSGTISVISFLGLAVSILAIAYNRPLPWQVIFIPLSLFLISILAFGFALDNIELRRGFKRSIKTLESAPLDKPLDLEEANILLQEKDENIKRLNIELSEAVGTTALITPGELLE